MLADAVAAGPPVGTLLALQEPDLSLWYGDPVGRQAAEALAGSACRQLRVRLCEGGPRFQLHVLLLACDFHLGGNIGPGYEQLAATTRSARERALLELVYGQLLVGSKCLHGLQHLGKGFSLAAGYLDTPGYFRLVRRHELLACLPASASPRAPLDLESLLTEARVIRRLQAGAGRSHPDTHHDTVG